MNAMGRRLQPGALRRAVDSLGWDAEAVEVADTAIARLGGMIVRAPQDASGRMRVLAIPNCDAVHTCFMRYPIDIAFIDSSGFVLAMHPDVAPWRFLSHPGATAVLERASILASSPPCFA